MYRGRGARVPGVCHSTLFRLVNEWYDTFESFGIELVGELLLVLVPYRVGTRYQVAATEPPEAQPCPRPSEYGKAEPLGDFAEIMGSNAATAACYSGTLGAAAEAALNGIPAIGVSLDTLNPDADFSAVRQFFPDIFRSLMSSFTTARQGVYFNVNFPDIPADKIKGIRVGHQGMGRWVREFRNWDPSIYKRYGITPESLGQASVPETEPGEKLYMMVGDFSDAPENDWRADHRLMETGYISIVADNIDATDYSEKEHLISSGLDRDFQENKGI